MANHWNNEKNNGTFQKIENRLPNKTELGIKGTIVSLRNILLSVCCVEIKIVTNQYISKYKIFNLL